MMQWVKPERFRVDYGFPWGSSGGLPTDLALWIIGLGIGMIWNPPRQPEKNGVVERSQGTGKRWAEPKQCDSLEELQNNIDQWPACSGKIIRDRVTDREWNCFLI